MAGERADDAGSDWRDELLAGVTAAPSPAGRDPLGWPGYEPRTAVRWGRTTVGGVDAVVAWWDFRTLGGSFGEADATAFCAAADAAAADRRPLVSLVRSGGTRLQEGVAALVGIPRARLALHRLSDAGVPHLAVCDQPTTGGVWISVGSSADVRAAVRGAVVGFAGPRVVEVVTGTPVPDDSHTAAAAAGAGLVDALLDGAEVADWVGRTLRALAPGERVDGPAAPPPAAGGDGDGNGDGGDEPAPRRGGWEQVRASRARTRSGGDLLDALLRDPVDLAAPGGDRTVRAVVGRLRADDRPVAAVALAADLGVAPRPAGYALLTRTADLADRLGLPLLALVDTPGAAPDPAAEAAGVAARIAEAMDAVLACRSPVVAVVHGEGGSGGALAAAVGDRLLVTPLATFTALGPEGAAAALRREPAEAADAAGLTPHDLRALGFADRVVPDDPAALGPRLAEELRLLAAEDPVERRERRRARWSSPLPGRVAPSAATRPA